MIVLSLNSAYAQDVTVITKGTPAPHDGLLFTREKALETRKEIIDADANKALVDSYKKSIDLYQIRESNYNNQIDLMVNQNTKLAQTNDNLRTQADFNKYVYFGLGIVVTAASIYAATKITQSAR